jgi:microcystin-dependent protein
MTEPFIAMLMLFAGNFPPRGWAFCNGQLLSIAQNTALFSLVGTTYGGNGQTTFGLPDLRGRVPIHVGQGPGLSNYVLGQVGGTETVTLLSNNMPIHTHSLNAVSEPGTVSAPQGAYLGNTGALDREYNTSGTVVAMNPGTISPAGGSQPFAILPPYLAISYCIALEGIFPSRN